MNINILKKISILAVLLGSALSAFSQTEEQPSVAADTVHPRVQLDLYGMFNCQDPKASNGIGLGVAWLIN